MFSQLSVILQLTPQRVPKQLLYTEMWKQVVADSSQSCVGCRGVFSFTDTFATKAAQLLGRPPDCLDVCYDVIFLIFWGKTVNDLHLWYSCTSIERAFIQCRFRYNTSGLGSHHNRRLLHYRRGDYYRKCNICGIAGKLGHIYLLCVSKGHLSLLFQSVPSFCGLCKWESSWAII